MAYEISFRRGLEAAFETLDSEAAAQIQKKLERVATDEWRSPADWSYKSWGGQSTGKFNWGSHRVFADIDESAGKIIVDESLHRENLYR
ncbi:hypothetical protein HWV23_10605 [Natronomonas halophila]|uniref:type II toxin-antitoxin system RelE family toxin n=1 Tax=Natronomonas halophila TaxID=2747817 RepID=UPI0015B4D438|nr:hypothetical protein [Natronomonas halophila]QLD86155.1 hypothetical protein HWV23_10605 [Natronomonas halophila]